MKVFVTGGTGFIGTHLVKALLRDAHEVTVLTREPSKVAPLARLKVVEGSLLDHDLLSDALAGHDACVHLALIWDVDESTDVLLEDTLATVALLKLASLAGVAHFVYTSSVGVHRPFRPSMSERDRLTPTDHYGATKAANEAFVSSASYQTAMRCNTIRPGPVLGSNVARFEAIARAALANEPIEVFRGDGRQFIAVADLVEVYTTLLMSDANRECYVAVSRNFTTWEQIAREVVALCHSKSPVVVRDPSTPLGHHFEVDKLERDWGLSFDSRGPMTRFLQSLIATTPRNP
jgi:UDP-glucose 4-epimerase